MDTLTHAFAVYAFFTLLRRPAAHRVAAAVGAAAPDIDGLFAWTSHVHELAFPLMHRGASHTIWGAPLLATFALWFASRPFFAARWRSWNAFQFRADTIGPLWIGAWSHLLLDGVTITGVPLLWPLDSGRYTTDWFFFGVQLLLPISLVGWIRVWRQKATDRSTLRVGAVLVVVLLLAGVLRISSFPAGLDGSEDVTPGPLDWSWYVSQRNETGVLAYETGLGGSRVAEFFVLEHNRTEAAAAIAACEQRPGYTAWSWGLWGLPVVNATRTMDGAWHIQFRDSGIVFANQAPSVASLRGLFRRGGGEDRPGATCLVDASGVADFDRNRGFIGG